MINFNSHDKICKSHFGAIEANRYQRLRLRLPPDCGVWQAFLMIREDSWANFELREMTFEFTADGALYYKTDIKLDRGLYWYKFKYTTENNEHYICRSGLSNGFTDKGGDCWQQTVYESSVCSPDWLLGGMIYQIFPDRFMFSGKEKSGIPDSRYMQTDWSAVPEYRQEGNKLSLGNDFYGGDLRGIEQKLDYLKSLGVRAIYLNPIFLASSNHRYNTGDYEKIDPVLGDEDDFVSLCNEAHKRGMYVILDGVFSHTGDDSRYFDRYHKFTGGACDSPNSKYRDWYKFTSWPHKYHSWWGIETLPEVIEETESYLEYICGENGILRRWLRLGADGWRLDVADELPDVFLDRLYSAVKSERPDAFILGEVWEDATTKVAYSQRRRYLLGGQLDSVMNYPFASAIVDFIKYGNASDFRTSVLSICENYPPNALNLLMNHIGTHDTARILTVLGINSFPETKAEQCGFVLPEDKRSLAQKRLYLAAALQFTLPGLPSVYYGDEAGMEGFGDPFCRATYPWGKENSNILEFYRGLGQLREKSPALRDGIFKCHVADGNALAYSRESGANRIFVAVSRGQYNGEEIALPSEFKKAKIVYASPGDQAPQIQNGAVHLPPTSFAIII